MTDEFDYEFLKLKALQGCQTAGEITAEIIGVQDPELVALAVEIAKVTLQGAQVYATLAQAEAEKDSAREFNERMKKTGRAPSQMPPVQPPRPVTPINKFRGENN